MGKAKVVELDKLCKIIGGGTPSKHNREFYNGNIPWASVRDMKSELISETEFKITDEAVSKSSTNIIKKGSLIIATRVGLGKVCFAGTDLAINQDLKGIIVNDKISNKYLFFYFKNIEKYLIQSGTGATVKGVKLDLIKKLKIPLPPLPEQLRIVAKLDGLFAKIDQAIGLLEENIAHTQALMGSVLDEEFCKLSKFNKPLMSFCANPKKDMVGGPFGSNLKASEYVEKGYPIIRLQNVDRFNFKEKNIMFVTEEKADFLSSHSYISGDIVMTKLGDPLGKCCVVEDVHGVNRGVISSDIIRIRIDENKNYKPYVVAGINSEYFIKQLKSKTQGSTRPRVKLKEVREMQLPMLKREDQVIAAKRIDGILELQSKVLTTQAKKLNHLKALKSSMLDQAFKGEL